MVRMKPIRRKARNPLHRYGFGAPCRGLSLRGTARTRTGDGGFAIRCLTTWLRCLVPIWAGRDLIKGGWTIKAVVLLGLGGCASAPEDVAPLDLVVTGHELRGDAGIWCPMGRSVSMTWAGGRLWSGSFCMRWRRRRGGRGVSVSEEFGGGVRDCECVLRCGGEHGGDRGAGLVVAAGDAVGFGQGG